MTSRLFKIFALLTLAVVLTTYSGCVMHSTGPTEVGVRLKKIAIFGKKGVQDQVYPPGATYFFLPFINEWYTLDTKLQNMEMTMDPNKGMKGVNDELRFKTIDGNDIGLDVIISYRINPKKAPHIIQNVAIDDNKLKENIVRTIARSIPRDLFGELKTEEFYIAQKRAEKAEKAKDVLNEIMDPYGVIVERVSTKNYRFNPAYQKAIEDKKVAEQQAEKNKAEAKATKKEYEKKLQDAIGEVNRIVARVDGEFQRAKLEADAYYEKQEMIAQAIETEGIAQAQGIAKMNEALAGSGGEVMVKLKIAETLKNKRIILLPLASGGMNLRTININELLSVYGMQSLNTQSR